MADEFVQRNMIYSDDLAIGFDQDNDLVILQQMPCGCCCMASWLTPDGADAFAKELQLAAAVKRGGCHDAGNA